MIVNRNKCCFNERTGVCGVRLHLTTKVFVLDKTKTIPIRIASQTACEAARNDFIGKKDNIFSKNYELHVWCVFLSF